MPTACDLQPRLSERLKNIKNFGVLQVSEKFQRQPLIFGNHAIRNLAYYRVAKQTKTIFKTGKNIAKITRFCWLNVFDTGCAKDHCVVGLM